jgi:glycosyltransferase involved in cell wall biosynthesis
MPSERPLRLTLVTETFPPEVNGVARTLGQWVARFRERGHHVAVIRPRQSADAPAPEHVHGIPLPFYPQLRFGVVSPMRLRGMLLRSAPDLIHVATEGPLGAATLLGASGLGLAVASSFHTNFDHYLAHYGFAGLESVVAAYLAWFHNQTDLTLAPGEAACRRLRSMGVRRTAVWGRGVDASLFHPGHRDVDLRRQLDLNDDDILLLYVGRLAAEKNLGALLDSFERLRRTSEPSPAERWKLALVGDGPLAPSIATRATPGIILAGEKHGTELSRWYASADLFVFPSQSETFGNVVLEAQASGLPVVGYDCQAVNERVAHGIDGLLVPIGGDLAQATNLLATDRALRRSSGAAARLKAEIQAWPAIFDHLEAIYRDLIDSRRARPPKPEPVLAGAADDG